MAINNLTMPRTVILHIGHVTKFTAGNVSAEVSSLPSGDYKIIAIRRTRRNLQGTTIHVSKEVRDEINSLIKSVRGSCGNQLTQDDVINHLLAAYKHTGANLCDW
ncbi:MAG: hypothetical protein PHS56_10210 [Eubacteriales bacterium]|nr:hypothetical protein [Eubacteriales bacterium]